MRFHLLPAVLLCAAVLCPNLVVREASAAAEFGEYCDPESHAIRNAQVKWRCAERGYSSSRQLYRSLEKRQPESRWETRWYWPNERMLENLDAKRFFWDCNPGKEHCGIWVEFTPERFLFVQQLLDRNAGNAWLGIGMTVYCGGSRAACLEFQREMAESVPMGDLRDSGWVGEPPPIDVPYAPRER
ncbi:MAG: hypothetical protein ACOY82_10610 [Pseudomonadota bacterium]